MDDIAIGRKEILALVNVSDWGTVRRWKRSGLPLRYLHNRKPMLITSELRAWMTSAGEAKTGETPRPDGWDGQKPL